MCNTCSSSTASPLGLPSGVFVGLLVVGGGAHGVGGVACEKRIMFHRKLIPALRILILAIVILGILSYAQRVIPSPFLIFIPRFFKVLRISMTGEHCVQRPGVVNGGLTSSPPSTVNVESTTSSNLNSIILTLLYKVKILR